MASLGHELKQMGRSRKIPSSSVSVETHKYSKKIIQQSALITQSNITQYNTTDTFYHDHIGKHWSVFWRRKKLIPCIIAPSPHNHSICPLVPFYSHRKMRGTSLPPSPTRPPPPPSRVPVPNGWFLSSLRGRNQTVTQSQAHKFACLGAWGSAFDLIHKSHNASVSYPTVHHFVTEMCTCVHISVTKWCIVGFFLMNRGICEMGLLGWARSLWNCLGRDGLTG